MKKSRLVKFWDWCNGDSQGYDPARISYYVDKNYIECLTFHGTKSRYLSGTLTDELWERICSWSRLESSGAGGMYTQIYIWAGDDDYLKGGHYIAYGDPVDAYVKNSALLKTGNGYGNKYHEIKRKEDFENNHKEFPTCKTWVNKEGQLYIKKH